GSIGRQTLDVVDSFHGKIGVAALAAGSNWVLLVDQVIKYEPEIVSVALESDAKLLKENLLKKGCSLPDIAYGEEGLDLVAKCGSANLVVTAISGAVGLKPTIAAINAGKDIALANKETLVAAGELVMKLAGEKSVNILPVDSEHSAIWQCLRGENPSELFRVILTASGGPFRGQSTEDLMGVTVEMALKHPNWSMGKKITIDSATLMNKGLEVIEAKWLFDVQAEDIKVVVQPESIIHSMVEFRDGSIIAQLGVPDMRIPIQYAISYPERWPGNTGELDFASLHSLTFEDPDLETFKCLGLAYEALKTGGTAPAVLNAANEIAVESFLKKEIAFLDIPKVIEEVLSLHNPVSHYDLDSVLGADAFARRTARKVIKRFNGR
ncbi:MAG TPA: 1-deoxy-D-xylulose-5-phosphate reductoisomerase, partial [Clostridia bacterium]|nr:1-deoxy-D-xylulose-5-phosphate reductoisomerase [Clostridia bacterium]